MSAPAETLCSVFESSTKATLQGIAACPEENTILVFSSAAEKDLADLEWVRSQLRDTRPSPRVVRIPCPPFTVRIDRPNLFRAALANIRPGCEADSKVYVAAGASIEEYTSGTLGQILRLDDQPHLVSAEHVLARGSGKGISVDGKYVVAHSTAYNGKLNTAKPTGDFEVGLICAQDNIVPQAQPICKAITPTSNWIPASKFDAICNLPVEACVDLDRRKATVIGVSACLDVHYLGLPWAIGTKIKRFHEHIILKADSETPWYPGDSGAMLFAASDWQGIEKGDALGIAFARSDGYLCATPFHVIAAALTDAGIGKIELTA